MKDPIYAGLATLPNRWDTLQLVLQHILPNVNRLFVYIDGPDPLPDFLHYHEKVMAVHAGPTSLGDTGKFLGLFATPEPAYWIIIDDDLYYPRTYVHDMIGWVDRYKRQAVVSIGGCVVQSPCTHYYGDARKARYHFRDVVKQPMPVNITNTGICAFHSGVVRPSLSDFPVPCMTDIWLGKWCNEHDVPQVVIPHAHDYLEHAPIDLDDTIWAKHGKEDEHKRKNDAPMAAAINSREWTVPRVA